MKKVNLALIVSIASFFISSLSFYFTNFRIKNKLQAKITEYSLIKNDATNKSDTVVIRVSYINKGNRQSNLIQPWYELADSNKFVDRTSILLSKKNFPSVLEANETKDIDFRIPLSSITSIIDNSKPIDTKFICYCRVKLLAQDFNFNNHTAYSEYVVRIEYTKNEIIRIVDFENRPLDQNPIIKLI
jgi:hypothetical protein